MAIRGFNMVGTPISRAVSGIVKTIRNAAGRVISPYFTKDEETNIRHVLSLNGVDQYLKLAKPVVGVGQGTLELVVKLSPHSSAYKKIVDGVSDVNRFDSNSDSSSSISAPSGVTASVDSGTQTGVFGRLQKITYTGDFTGREIGNFFARFDGTSHSEAQVFSISYEDEAQSFTYDFNVAQNYWLPEEKEVSRSYTPVQATVSIPNAYNTLTIPNSDPIEIGDCYLYKFKLVSCPVGASARMRSLNGSSGGYISEGGIAETVGVADATAITLQGSIAGDYVVEMLEVREIPNALILQSPSANIADDFEPMVQKPSGEWEGLKDYFAPTSMNVSWGQEGKVFTKNSSAWGGMGELLGANTIDPGDWRVYVTHNGPTTNLGIYTRNEAGTGNTPLNLITGKQVYDISVPTGGLWFDDDDALGESVSGIKYHPLIKLSDHLQKQFIIEQTKAAVATYQAKNKTRNITTSDGVDDRVVLPEIVLLGDFTISRLVCFKSEGQQDLFGKESYLKTRLKNGEVECLVGDGASWECFLSSGAQLPLDNAWRWVTLTRAGNEFLLEVDHMPYTSATAFGPVDPRIDGTTATSHYEGTGADLIVIDHENPLPLGQGGNSGYWPLDDPKGTIAANKLGLDSKGNVVVKDGAGSEVVYNETAVFDHTDGNWAIQHKAIGLFEGGATYSVTLDATQLDVGYIQIDNAEAQDAKGQWRPSCPAGESKTYLWYPSATGDVSIQKNNIPVSGTATAKIVKLHGYGEWQGLPSDFSSTDEYTRNADGAYVGLNIAVSEVSGVIGDDGSIEYFNVAPVEAGFEYVISATVDEVVGVSTGEAGWAAHGGVPQTDEYKFNSGNLSPGDVIGGEFIATSSTFVRLFGRSNAIAAYKDMSVQKAIPLSAELQRQHDLAIVETSVGKLLKKAAKTETFAHLDGVDDHTAIPAKSFDGSFEIERSFYVSNTSDKQWLYSDWIDNVPERSVGIRIRNGKLETYISHDGIAAIVGPTVAVEAGLRHTFKFKFNSGVSMELSLDNANPVVVLTDKESTFTTNNEINLGRKSTDTDYLDGKDGYLLLKDIANPKNSRFYVHNPLGYLEDKLSAIGENLWEFNGVITSGNQWGDLYVDGELVHDSGAGSTENVLVKAKLSNIPAGGSIQLRIGGLFQVGLSESSAEYVGLVKANNTSLSAVEASPSGTIVGANLEVEVLPVPTWGTYSGFSPDHSEIKTFKKKGDDWLGVAEVSAVTDLTIGAAKTIFVGLEVGELYQLGITGQEGQSTKVYLDGWVFLTDGMQFNATQANLAIANFALDQSGLNLTLTKVIKGA